MMEQVILFIIMTRQMERLDNKNGGFSLVELVLMLSLLAIMVVLYVESAGDLSNIAVDGASRKAQSDIRYAQQLAQSTGGVYGVKFNSGGTYEVYVGSPGHPVNSPTTNLPLIEDFHDFPGVAISTNYQVQFDPMGRPTMGADSRMRLTASSGAIRDVYVIDQTGAVIVDLIQRGTGCHCEICYKE